MTNDLQSTLHFNNHFNYCENYFHVFIVYEKITNNLPLLFCLVNISSSSMSIYYSVITYDNKMIFEVPQNYYYFQLELFT